MTIRKGSEWGSPYTPTGAEPVAHSDAEAMRAMTPALESGDEVPTVLLRGGDLYRMLGGRPAVPAQRCSIDVLEVVADDRRCWAIGHVIARRRLWAGRFVVAMNGQFVGEWNLGPRAHPNDGRVDLTDGSLRWGQRLKAARRVPSGTHVPHPMLHTSRAAAVEVCFDTPIALYLDGLRAGRCRHLVINVRPDAASVVF